MFWAVFSIFIVATLVLIVFTVRWAIRQDRFRRGGPDGNVPRSKD
jgi:hypothetical protein